VTVQDLVKQLIDWVGKKRDVEAYVIITDGAVFVKEEDKVREWCKDVLNHSA